MSRSAVPYEPRRPIDGRDPLDPFSGRLSTVKAITRWTFYRPGEAPRIRTRAA